MTSPSTASAPGAAPGGDDTGVLDTQEAGPRAIRGGAVRLVAFAATVLVSVGSSAVVFRHLGVVRTGHYVTIISLVTLCAGLTDAGLSAIGVREFSTRDSAGRRTLMRDLSGLRLALAIAGALVAVVFALLVGYGRTLVIGAAIAGVGMVLVVMEDTYAISLTAQLRVGWVALSDLLRVVVLAVTVVALALAGADLVAFYAAAVPAAACAVALNALLVRHDVPLLPSVHPARWRAILRETLSFSFATAVIAVYFRVAVILVSLISSGRQTGYFSVSFRVVEVLLSVPALLVGVMFPIFAHAAQNDRVRLDYAIGRVFDALWLVGLGVALALFLGAPFIIRVVAGPDFQPSEVVLQIQGLALIASFVGSVFAYALLSLHRHREILIVSLLALLVAAGLVATLASLDGARGAATGTALGEAVFVLMLGVTAYHVPIRPLITWSNIPRSVIAAALGAGTLAIAGMPSVVRLAIGVTLYAAVLLLLKAVPVEILEQLPWRRKAA